MRAVLHVADAPGERLLAVVEDGALVAVEVQRTGAPDRIDELHLARVGAAAVGAAGWYVALADAEAFLPAGEVPRARRPLRQGEAVAVRVARAAMGGKGLRVSMKRVVVPLPDRTAPCLLRAAPDAVDRLAAQHDATVQRADRLSEEVEAALAELLQPIASLPGGGRIAVHPTPAATLIDVDAGGQAPAAANAAATVAAARHIRARNLSGVILVDFAALDGAEAKRRAADALRAALAADPLRAEVTGHSPAGLIEVVRRKLRPPLHEVLCAAQAPFVPAPLTLGLAALRRALAEALATPALRPALHAAPTVVAALHAAPGALEQFAARAGEPLALRADPTLAPGAWRIADARHGQ
jgi:hypothetical protein